MITKEDLNSQLCLLQGNMLFAFSSFFAGDITQAREMTAQAKRASEDLQEMIEKLEL
ncbi:hypothetical protein LCGC14_1038760 [marine sediment metagenome]|uniref:Uncharacterized protein n=1 Tax=marine sediment metagenome TaxID=412755 RepID=A0A0F9MSE1_9ZZZZ